jgi:hypothetical protein
MSWVFPSVGFVEFPTFLRENEKNSTYIIYLKYIKQNTDSQTNEYFSGILRNVFQEFSRMPNFKHKKIYLKNLIVSLSANFFKILSQNNNC